MIARKIVAEMNIATHSVHGCSTAHSVWSALVDNDKAAATVAPRTCWRRGPIALSEWLVIQRCSLIVPEIHLSLNILSKKRKLNVFIAIQIASQSAFLVQTAITWKTRRLNGFRDCCCCCCCCFCCCSQTYASLTRNESITQKSTNGRSISPFTAVHRLRKFRRCPSTIVSWLHAAAGIHADARRTTPCTCVVGDNYRGRRAPL